MIRRLDAKLNFARSVRQCCQCSSSCVETPVILRAKFHTVSSLLTVNSDFDAVVKLALALH